MPYQYQCSNCQSRLKVPDKLYLKAAKCPKCQAEIDWTLAVPIETQPPSDLPEFSDISNSPVSTQSADRSGSDYWHQAVKSSTKSDKRPSESIPSKKKETDSSVPHAPGSLPQFLTWLVVVTAVAVACFIPYVATALQIAAIIFGAVPVIYLGMLATPVGWIFMGFKLMSVLLGGRVDDDSPQPTVSQFLFGQLMLIVYAIFYLVIAAVICLAAEPVGGVLARMRKSEQSVNSTPGSKPEYLSLAPLASHHQDIAPVSLATGDTQQTQTVRSKSGRMHPTGLGQFNSRS